VTIPGISGVNLTGGQTYFMVIVTGSSNWNAWNFNTQGVTGLDLYSIDGGSNWVSNGDETLGAFDVIGGVPEPSTMLLLGTGLLGVMALRRRT
jgi:hypothetical protein